MTLDDQVLESEHGIDALDPCRQREVGETNVVEVVDGSRGEGDPRVRRVHREGEQRRFGQTREADVRRHGLAIGVKGETRDEGVAVEALDRQLAQLRMRIELDAD